MGKAKTLKTPKVQKRKYKRRTKRVDFKTGIILIIIGIVLGIDLFLSSSAGTIGQVIKNVIIGTFGTLSYSLPFVLLISGLYILAEKPINFKMMGCYVSLYLCLTSFLYLFAEYNIYNSDFTFTENLIDIYGYKGMIAGGALGGIIGMPLINVFGIIVTFIIFVIWLIITLCKFSESIFDNLVDNTTNISKWILDKTSVKNKKNNNKSEIKQSYINNVSRDEELVIQDEPTQLTIDDKEISDDIKDTIKELTEVEGIKEVKDIKDEPVEKLNLGHTEVGQIQVDYKMPPDDLLIEPSDKKRVDGKALKDIALKLESTLKSFGVEAKVLNVSKGPTITRYELSPAIGVKVSKIVGLADDIALNLAVSSIRIAPIEGKSAIGIEVPNKENDSVTIKEIITSKKFKEAKSNISFAVGKNISGEIVIGDIAKMPHLLIAGSTGSGKSVCINALIMSILYKARPDQVKFIMIDPKVVELGVYNNIPHLLIPVVTDPRKAAGALQWAVQEMVNRYNLFADKGVRDITSYNELLKAEGCEGVLPQVVIIIDELSDLMMVAPNDVEDAICRLAQMARAAGMNLVIATQRPSVDVVTGLIKANVPSRIAFSVSSQIDSRTILDMGGAEKLLGKGDMLYYPTGVSKPIRLQGPFVSNKEVENVIEFIKNGTETVEYDADIIEKIENGVNNNNKPKDVIDDVDPLLNRVIEEIIDSGQASASMVQRRFKVGYNRAARIIDDIQERGLISASEGSKGRRVLISKEQWENMKEQGEV